MKVDLTISCMGKPTEITLKLVQQQSGRIKVSAVDTIDRSPFGDVTKQGRGVNLEPGEILVKTYSENAYWVPQLLELLPDLFEDTGKRVPCGFSELHVWRVLKDVAEKYVSVFKAEFPVSHSEEDASDVPPEDFLNALLARFAGINGPEDCVEVARYNAEDFHGIKRIS